MRAKHACFASSRNIATCQVGGALMTILGVTLQDIVGTYMKMNEAREDVCTLRILHQACGRITHTVLECML